MMNLNQLGRVLYSHLTACLLNEVLMEASASVVWCKEVSHSEHDGRAAVIGSVISGYVELVGCVRVGKFENMS